MSNLKGPSALILAGGDGTRLRSLTRRIAGDERPKQFCQIFGNETLLEQTRRRVALTIAPKRTLVVLTRRHERFYAPLLADVPPGHLIIQPANRGTSPAILYGVLRLATMAPTDPVALFPSDHYVSDDEAFMTHVGTAVEAVRMRPDLVVLLGITPDSPDVQYGWIEPGDAIPIEGPPTLYRVRRFWEKPSLATARALLARGCLWNAFVMVARVPALLSMIRHAVPDMYRAFLDFRSRGEIFGEREAIRALYARFPSMNFSEQVLAAARPNLAVLPVSGVWWSDWGDPHRVLVTLARIGVHPEWADRPEALPA